VAPARRCADRWGDRERIELRQLRLGGDELLGVGRHKWLGVQRQRIQGSSGTSGSAAPSSHETKKHHQGSSAGSSTGSSGSGGSGASSGSTASGSSGKWSALAFRTIRAVARPMK